MYILYSEAIRQLCLRKRLKIVVFIYFLCVEMRRQSGKLLLLCLTEERRPYKELKMHILKMGWGGYFYIKIIYACLRYIFVDQHPHFTFAKAVLVNEKKNINIKACM